MGGVGKFLITGYTAISHEPPLTVPGVPAEMAELSLINKYNHRFPANRLGLITHSLCDILTQVTSPILVLGVLLPINEMFVPLIRALRGILADQRILFSFQDYISPCQCGRFLKFCFAG